MKTWAVTAAEYARTALAPHRDHARAGAAERNLQFVAPFLGISPEDRRHFLNEVWEVLPEPTSTDLGDAALLLMRFPEREYHYAAHDLLAKHIDCADGSFLPTYVETLLTTVPFWDTIDAFSVVAVSPLCRRYGHADIVERWSESGDEWLIRAALQHQRTWGDAMDAVRVLELCDRHWGSDSFHVAKTVGIMVARAGRVDRPAAIAFLRTHDGDEVAAREANRGLGRL